jgi:hypothetical protein
MLVLPLLASSLASASEQPELFESTRASGRGGTYVAAYDSYEGSRHNPATLGEFDKSMQLRILDLDLMVGKNVLGLISDLNKVFSSKDALSGLKQFDDKFGQRQALRGQLSLLSMRFGHFEVSPFAVNSSWLDLRDRQIPKVAWEVDTYAGMQFSYGHMVGKNWSFGVALRPMYRIYFGNQLTFSDITEMVTPDDTKFKDLAQQKSGTGVGVDLGGMWMPSPTWRVGLTLQNLGDMGYGQDNGTEPKPIRQKIVELGESPGQRMDRRWAFSWRTAMTF